MIEIVLLVVLLVLSGVFSGSETALVDLSIGRVESLAKGRRAGAQALLELKSDPSRMLTTILIGNNIINITASVLATVIATRYFGSMGPGIAVGALTVLILVFGEITPKSLATRYAERISLFIAPFLLFFMRVIYPLVWFFGLFTKWVHRLSGNSKDPVVTELELISMLGHGELEGTIESTERRIIENVFEFNDLTIRDVMTPHNEVFSLDSNLTVAEALPTVVDNRYSRIPLYDGDSESFSKLLYMRDLLTAVASGNENARLADISHDLIFVSQYQPIDEFFKILLRRKRHFAIVVDEHGVIRGVVTLEDLIEELVGEIYDESDAPTDDMKVLSEDEIEINGAAELRIIEEFFQIEMPRKSTDTIRLWILKNHEYIPKENEVLFIDSFEIKILKATPRQIDRVSIKRVGGAQPEQE
jgi:CBS domain containing-hemolysin-like protein